MSMEVASAPRAKVESAVDAAQQADPGQPIRMRIQPQIRIKHLGYRMLHNVSWTVRCQAEEIEAVKQALSAFFRVLALKGPAGVIELLDKAQADQ